MQIHAIKDDINPIEETYIEEEAYVLDEDETQRSEYSKDFIMSDKITQKITIAEKQPIHGHIQRQQVLRHSYSNRRWQNISLGKDH